MFNCTPDSGLKSLPYYPYEKAVDYVRTECSKPMDTAGWYDSANKAKPAATALPEVR